MVVTVTGRRLDAKYMYILLFTCMMLRFCFYNMLTRMVFALTSRQFNLEASSCFAIQQLFLVDMTTDFGSLEFDDQDSRYVLNVFVTVFDHFAGNCPISPASRHELDIWWFFRTYRLMVGPMCSSFPGVWYGPRSWLTLTEARAVYKLNCDKVKRPPNTEGFLKGICRMWIIRSILESCH